MPEITDFEPHLVAEVNKAGNIFVSKKNAGKKAYIYFLRDVGDQGESKE